MNKQEADILKALAGEPRATQRALSQATGHSLGVVNRSLKTLQAEGYLAPDLQLTPQAYAFCATHAPRGAIILAAGMGMRMAPINVVNPKALMEVHGQTLIERLIGQLHEVGVTDITVVVGFMKEKFDYLIDLYGVKLVVNTAYVRKNNLTSLALVADRLANSYVLPSDVWCARNPFSRLEPYSWYMVGESLVPSEVRVNRKGELVYTARGIRGNAMRDLAYVSVEDAATLRDRLLAMADDLRFDDAFWEEALRDGDRMLLAAKVVSDSEIVEVNTYEELRELDGGTSVLGQAELAEAAAAIGVAPAELGEAKLVKKGLVNSTFVLEARGQRYAVRIPADRQEADERWQRERDALTAVAGLGLSEEVLFLDVHTGHKVSRFIEGARPCDPASEQDVTACMATLRHLHEASLAVPATFDPFDTIQRYEDLRAGEASMFRDYAATKARVMALRGFVAQHAAGPCLVHVDPVPENFLFADEKNEPEAGAKVVASAADQLPRLIDWEYAAMGDPHVDLAMFAVYSHYNKAQVDRLIDLYFAPVGGCDAATRAKVYAYVAACGLMWSNWCEHKWHQGVEFGEYSLTQYRYAKDFCTYATGLMQETGDELGDK